MPALLDSEHPIIREGIRAMLADRHSSIRQKTERQRAAGWTAWQLSDAWLERHLDLHRRRWSDLANDPQRRQQRIDRLVKFAMPWY